MNFPYIHPIAFSIGPLDIRWYSLSYIAGIFISWIIVRKFLINSNKNISKEFIDELLNYAVIGIIVGGRLGYVLFYNFEYYLFSPIEILKIWKGGMSFHGGLIGIIIAIIIYSNKRKINYLEITDMIALVSPIGIFFGRIANFINGELFGRITYSKFGIIFPNGGDLPRHPSQLYEAFFEGIAIFLILNLLFFFSKFRFYKGFFSGMFLFLYGFFRFFVEYFREPDSQIGYFFEFVTLGQILCIPMIILGIFIISKVIKKQNNAKS